MINRLAKARIINLLQKTNSIAWIVNSVSCEDIAATHRYIIYSGKEFYPLKLDIFAVPADKINLQLLNDMGLK